MKRRTFLGNAAAASGLLFVPPSLLAGCGSSSQTVRTDDPVSGGGFDTPPIQRPGGWDPVKYNLERGDAGFIPASYMAKIKDRGGIVGHLGKHLPYTVPLAAERAAPGHLPVMWGSPEKGYARHPNGRRTAENPAGHWYDWIRIAPEGDVSAEVTTAFDEWPAPSAGSGRIVGLEGADPAADGGRNSVYLARLPRGTRPGDWVRVWAHCLTHGEYVDFVQVG